jgi:hypothetical protein
MLLRPWTSTPASAMSKTQAIAAALRYANKATAYPRRALKAVLTRPGRIPRCSHNRAPPVWVVTFTSPQPVNVAVGGVGSPSRPLYVTHYSVAMNAVTGKMVLGFFER